jgi:thiamine biosynthesis lipoprotein
MINAPAFRVAVIFGAWAAGAREAQPALARYAYDEPHMGTRFQIVLYAPEEASAQRAAKAAFQRIADLDGIMSDYRPTSELMRLCQQAGGPPVPVSPELFFVLSKAQEVSRLSGGAFDVTVGPVVRLWRRARRTQRLPDPKQLTEARTLVGYDQIILDAKAQAVQLTKTGMLLDLGGIAKGYAADEALAVLRKHGVIRALVAAGGDIAVTGPPPDAEGWKVGLAPLEQQDQKPAPYLLLQNAAVSTSGDAEQYVEINGTRYSHIVDPKTGLGLVGRQSATVVARYGIDADSLTKVVIILGPPRGLSIIDGVDGASALLVRQTDKGLETFSSKRFPRIHHKGTKDTKETREEGPEGKNGDRVDAVVFPLCPSCLCGEDLPRRMP